MNRTTEVSYHLIPQDPQVDGKHASQDLRAHRHVDPIKTGCIAHKALTFVGKFFICVICLPYGLYKTVQWFSENKHSAKLRVQKYTAALDELSEKLNSNSNEEVFSLITKFKKTDLSLDIESKTKKVLDILKNRSKFKNDRQAHNAFIKALRDALSCKEYSLEKKFQIDTFAGKCQFILRTICYIRYTQVHLDNHIQDVFTTLIPEDQQTEPKTLSETAKIIYEDSRTINKSPLCHRNFAKLNQRFRGHYNINFNASGTINIPYVKGSLTLGGREIVQLRHGSPTREMGIFNAILVYVSRIFGNFHNAEIVPEYIGFLDYLAYEKIPPEQVLYTNHQKTTSPTICFGGNESDRVHALENFNHPAFNYLSLPVGDKAIFKIEREFAKAKNTNDYKLLLMDAIKHDRYGIKIPDSLKAESLFIERLGVMFDEVHDLYFENQADTFDQRTALTLIFFAYLQLTVMQRLNVQYVVNSCKDNIDRGSTFSAILELINTLSQGQEPNEEELQRLRIHMIAAPYLVRKTGVLSKRSIYLEMVLNHLQTLTLHQKVTIKDRKNLMILSPLEIEQSAFEQVMTSPPSGASSISEYRKLLEIFILQNQHQRTYGCSYDTFYKKYITTENIMKLKQDILESTRKDLNRQKLYVDGILFDGETSDTNIDALFKHLMTKFNNNEKKVLEFINLLNQRVLIYINNILFEYFSNFDMDATPFFTMQDTKDATRNGETIIANTSSEIPEVIHYKNGYIKINGEEASIISIKTRIQFSDTPTMDFSLQNGEDKFQREYTTIAAQ